MRSAGLSGSAQELQQSDRESGGADGMSDEYRAEVFVDAHLKLAQIRLGGAGGRVDILDHACDGIGLRTREAALLQLFDGRVRIESECRHTLVGLAVVGRGERRDGALSDIVREAASLQFVDERIELDVDHDHTLNRTMRRRCRNEAGDRGNGWGRGHGNRGDGACGLAEYGRELGFGEA